MCGHPGLVRVLCCMSLVSLSTNKKHLKKTSNVIYSIGGEGRKTKCHFQEYTELFVEHLSCATAGCKYLMSMCLKPCSVIVCKLLKRDYGVCTVQEMCETMFCEVWPLQMWVPRGALGWSRLLRDSDTLSSLPRELKSCIKRFIASVQLRVALHMSHVCSAAYRQEGQLSSGQEENGPSHTRLPQSSNLQ